MKVLVSVLAPFAGLLIQLLLYLWQPAATVSGISSFWFDAAGAAVLALSVLLSPLPTYLPVYQRMRSVNRSPGLTWALRTHYAMIALLAGILGSHAYPFYSWFFGSILQVGENLISAAEAVPPLPLDILTTSVFSALFPSSQIPMLGRTAVIAVVLSAGHRLTRELGPRAVVEKRFHRHSIKFALKRQETRFEFICLGLGFTASYHLSFVLLAFAALRGASDASLEKWAVDRALVNRRTGFDALGFEIFQGILVSSLVWAPFYDPAVPNQTVFVTVLCAPLALAVLLSILCRTASAQVHALEISLRFIYSSALIGAGVYQLFHPDANPFGQWLTSQGAKFLDPPLYASFAQVIPLLFFGGLVSAGCEPWLNRPDLREFEQNPIGAYLDRKRTFFAMSMVLRGTLLMFYASNLVADDPLVRILPALALACVLMIDDDMDTFAKRLRDEFSDTALVRSIGYMRPTLSRFMNLRQAANLSFVAGVTVFAVTSGDSLILITTIPVAALVALFYYVQLSTETASARRHLGLVLETAWLPTSVSRRLTFGLYRTSNQTDERSITIPAKPVSRPPARLSRQQEAKQALMVGAALTGALLLLALVLNLMMKDYQQTVATGYREIGRGIQFQIPELTAPVNDFAHVISPSVEREIVTAVARIRLASDTIVVVMTIPSIRPATDIQAYSMDVFGNHGQGIGEAGKNNGVLILLALEDREVRITLGYGIEQYVTNDDARRVVEKMVERIRTGDVDSGVHTGVREIERLLRERKRQ